MPARTRASLGPAPPRPRPRAAPSRAQPAPPRRARSWSLRDQPGRPITIALDQDKAPVTVDNFLKYVTRGPLRRHVFHRVIPDFMVQGGGMDAR